MKRKAFGILALFLCVGAASAGDLSPPPGPVAPTPGPEPRKPIDAVHTPGDGNSIYKITASGSYYLTGNFTGAIGKYGIEIAANDVSIDLMGFSLVGVAASLDGVGASVAVTNIEVRNGTSRSWGGDGVDLTTFVSAARAENLDATLNAADGIRMGDGSIITRCVASSNGGDGIQTGNSCVIVGCAASNNTGIGIRGGALSTISDCTALTNAQDGIQVLAGSTATACAARGNATYGFSVASSCTLTACTAYENLDSGIHTGSECTISGCTSGANGASGFELQAACTISGCTATGNTDDGIEVTNDCSVIGNTCDANGGGDGAGIHATSADNRIEGNNCTDADRGIDVDTSGSIIIRNTCSGNFSNWDVVAGNFLIVIDATAAPAVLGDAGGASLGSTNAWANFTY